MDSSFRFVSAAVTDRGLSDKRPENEDSYLEMGQCGIYAVADGVGGAQAGEVASQMAVEILAEAFTNISPSADAESVMRTAIERANAAIYEMAQELPQLASMATTVVALHLAENIATIGHVGDSRLYRVDRAGQLHRETDDHSMVAEEVRAGRMTQEQAETHPSRNIISRALGAEPTVDIDLKTMMIEPGTAFLICSDGITRHVADQEIKGVLTFGGEPVEVCEYLKSLCFGRGAEDNLTAVVVKVSAAANEIEVAAHEDTGEVEEATIATARSVFEPGIADDEDDGLLELDTRKFPKSEADADAEQEDPGSDEATIADTQPEPVEPEPPRATQPDRVETFSMFGEAGSTGFDEAKPASGGKIVAGILMLLIGTSIGLGVYHFGLVAPRTAEPDSQQLSLMKNENIAFSSFEKNRRNVDSDPDAYLREVPPPEDAEDYYLIARAHMLKGDFLSARTALIRAQKLVTNAEQANIKILATDIAIALLIANDPSIQNKMRLEIDGALNPRDAANANAATISVPSQQN